MPGFLLHVGAKVLCAHGGQASPMTPNPRVLIMGQPIVTMDSLYNILGCSLSPGAGGPCSMAQWVSGSVRVFSNGMPVLLMDSCSICGPTGTPLLPTVAQGHVVGT